MNKILLSVLAVVGIAGSGYFFLTQEHVDEFAQYLPEPISSFISSDTKTEELMAQTSEKQDIVVQHNTQNKVENTVQDNSESSQSLSSAIPPPPVFDLAANEGNIDIKKEAQSVVSKVDGLVKTDPIAKSEEKVVKTEAATSKPEKMPAQQHEKMADTSADVEKKSADVKQTPEVSKLQNHLETVQKSVMQIDAENKMLQDRFQKILKKNRDLAVELKKINDKIQMAN